MKVSIDIERLTLGDMERLETGRISDMLAVYEQHLQIEGVAPEDVGATIRKWTIKEFHTIAESIGESLSTQTNPVRNGKN
jgi:hypothetical protein